MRDLKREERMEAARYGSLHEVVFDPEAFLHRAAKQDPRLRDVLKGLQLARDFPNLLGTGRQVFSEAFLPVMTADYAAVAPAAATEIVLWTPNTTTQPHSAFTQNSLFAGQVVKSRAGGIMTVPATAGTTLVTPRYGTSTAGISLGASVAVAAGTISQTNIPWIIQAMAWIRSQGATATMVMLGTLETNGIARDAIFGGTTATIDTTTAQGLTYSLTESAGSYSWTPKGIETEIIG